MTVKTKSQAIAEDVSALLRARNPLLWIVTREEARVERYLMEASASAGYLPRTWDIAQGVATMDGSRIGNIGGRDPGDTLESIMARAREGNERGAWIMRDLAPWLDGVGGATTVRQVRNLARYLPGVARSQAQAIIVLTPSADVPKELAGHATVINWPMPDREEIAAILDACIGGLPEEMQATAAPNGTRDAAIDAAIGLSGEEAQACYARSLVQLRCIDPGIVSREKRRVIARERVLEWFDPLPGGLDAVGGLEMLKAWLIQRKQAYTPAARAYGLPAPKGALLVGPPGTGKSLTAKAVATAFGVPLLRLDLGALKSKFVGDSEANIRKAFAVIETIGRCVVFLDELDKVFAGAANGSADGGVSSDALGAVLTWMQERSGDAFVVATANDPTKLPVELVRKGRFDECWFLDLPTRQERADVISAALRANGRGSVECVQHYDIAEATEGFTSSEIAALVPEALFAAFSDGAREITTTDLLLVARATVPLSKSAAEKIARMREWARTFARAASLPEVEIIRENRRALDL